MFEETSSQLAKEQSYQHRNIVCVRVCGVCVWGVALKEEEWFFEEKKKCCCQQPLQPFLFPFTSVWNPGIAQTDRDERWESEEEKRGDRQTEAKSVRDGHVRFPAPQLAPLHTNTEPEMNRSGISFTVNMNFGFVWQLYSETQRQPSQ